MTPLQYIKDRVREVCTEILRDEEICPECKRQVIIWGSRVVREIPIGLAEILRTLDDSTIVIEAKTGQFGEETPEGVLVGGFPIWNLEKTLDEQDTPTVEFIASILGYERNN